MTGRHSGCVLWEGASLRALRDEGRSRGLPGLSDSAQQTLVGSALVVLISGMA